MTDAVKFDPTVQTDSEKTIEILREIHEELRYISNLLRKGDTDIRALVGTVQEQGPMSLMSGSMMGGFPR